MVNGTDIHSSRARIAPGTCLNGIYEIDHLIGIGGMGEIYKGHAIQTNDPVAIKLMLPELAESEAALALFRKEASALHYLHHEAIVRYYVFTVEPVLQRPYLAMEFVDGRSLSAILQQDGPLPFEAVRSLMLRVAAGLQVAHERGIIHRDVSPDNIIVPGGDVTRAKIIDFGIARSTQLSEGTVIGSGFAGKHNYVSPEQLGLFGGNVTAKSDIYSLGLVLVQALTGQAIDMGGTQFQIVDKRRKIPDLGAIDIRFRRLLEKMLQPDPHDRPESMAAVATWPLGLPGGLRARDPTLRSAALSQGGARRWRRVALAVLLLAIVVGAGGGYYLYGTGTLGLAPEKPALEATLTPLAPALSPAGTSTTAPPAPVPAAPAPLAPVPAAPVPPASVTAPPAATKPPASPATPSPAPPSPASVPPVAPRPDVVAGLPRPPSSTDQIKRYLELYDGGECFFVTPVAVGQTKAAVEGLGATLQAFYDLDERFKRDHGFAADIGVRQVTAPQCPAITFLNNLRDTRAGAPRLDLDKVNLKSGDILTGSVERFGNRNLELLLVTDAGTVLSVSHLLKSGTDAKSFSIGMTQRDGVAGSLPQLLVAVATPKPMASLKTARPTPASQFFPGVLSEAKRTDQALGVTARYFKLEN